MIPESKHLGDGHGHDANIYATVAGQVMKITPMGIAWTKAGGSGKSAALGANDTMLYVTENFSGMDLGCQSSIAQADGHEWQHFRARFTG
jgi:hypothetical protein